MTTPQAPVGPGAVAGPSSQGPTNAASGDWLAQALRPRVVLSLLAVVMVVAVILTPDTGTSTMDLRLTTYSAGPASAKGLYDVVRRLGWPTARRLVPFREPLDSDAVYAVLGGPEALTARETHTLLDAVRRGAGLVYVVDNRSPLTDSLPLRHSSDGGPLAGITGADTAACPPRSFENTLLWLGNSVHLFYLQDSLDAADSSKPARVPDDTAVFLSVHPTSRRFAQPAIVGYPFGRGRVVAVSDPDALRNDIVRVCGFGIGPRIIAAIDYASVGRRPPLVFDEYHEGYGEHASMWTPATGFLERHALGHTILQLLAGGLVLILALGVRALAPRTMPHIERRSALEHVDALARAYERIDATRTAVERLVRGLRRRHDRSGWSLRAQAAPGGADDRFLAAVAASHPALAGDVKQILAAEHQTVQPGELLEVAAAVDRIDRAFPASQHAVPVHHNPR
jgi:hypothetical protein